VGDERKVFAGRARAALACVASAVAALLVLLAVPAVSLATGGIAGQITEAASPHGSIQGIEACAFTTNPSTSGEEGSGEFGCAVTGAGGEYEIDGLNAGSYDVCFSMPLVTTLDFVGECYDGKKYEQEPTPVAVTEGAVTRHIDGELEAGAELEGTVTAAGTGAPLEGALVCAAPSKGGTEPTEAVSCAKAGAGGAFTLAGLPAGTFDVSFFYFGHEETGSGYLGGHTFAEATPVTVAAKEVRTGLNAVLTLSHIHVGPPAGGPEGGPPGTGTSGANGGSGSTSLARGLSLAASRIHVGLGGRARVAVTCSGTSACRGRIALRERLVSRGRKAHTVVLGSVRYSVAAGANTVLTLKLDALGRRDLRTHHGKLPFRAAIVPSAPAPDVVSVKNVVLVAASRKASRHA
jgi:hypothetical protein